MQSPSICSGLLGRRHYRIILMAAALMEDTGIWWVWRRLAGNRLFAVWRCTWRGGEGSPRRHSGVSRAWTRSAALGFLPAHHPHGGDSDHCDGSVRGMVLHACFACLHIRLLCLKPQHYRPGALLVDGKPGRAFAYRTWCGLEWAGRAGVSQHVYSIFTIFITICHYAYRRSFLRATNRWTAGRATTIGYGRTAMATPSWGGCPGAISRCGCMWAYWPAMPAHLSSTGQAVPLASQLNNISK